MKIHIKLDGEEKIDQDFSATISKRKIEYLENKVNVTITKYKDHLKIERKCNDYFITLNLKKGTNTSYYQVFGSDKVFELETIVSKYNVTDKLIEIDYDLEGNKFSFKLEVIE